MFRDAYKQRGLLPDRLLDQTPGHLVSLFFKPAGTGRDGDELAGLAKHNRMRAERGQPPAVPRWLMPKVPRER